MRYIKAITLRLSKQDIETIERIKQEYDTTVTTKAIKRALIDLIILKTMMRDLQAVAIPVIMINKEEWEKVMK